MGLSYRYVSARNTWNFRPCDLFKNETTLLLQIREWPLESVNIQVACLPCLWGSKSSRAVEILFLVIHRIVFSSYLIVFKTTALQLGNRKILIIHHQMVLLFNLVLSKLWTFFSHLNKHMIKLYPQKPPTSKWKTITPIWAKLILICLFIHFYSIRFCPVRESQQYEALVFLTRHQGEKIWSSFWFEFIGFTVIPVNGFERWLTRHLVANPDVTTC